MIVFFDRYKLTHNYIHIYQVYWRLQTLVFRFVLRFLLLFFYKLNPLFYTFLKLAQFFLIVEEKKWSTEEKASKRTPNITIIIRFRISPSIYAMVRKFTKESQTLTIFFQIISVTRFTRVTPKKKCVFTLFFG